MLFSFIEIDLCRFTYFDHSVLVDLNATSLRVNFLEIYSSFHPLLGPSNMHMFTFSNMRSIAAPAKTGSLKTCGHSSTSRLLIGIIAELCFRRSKRSKISSLTALGIQTPPSRCSELYKLSLKSRCFFFEKKHWPKDH